MTTLAPRARNTDPSTSHDASANAWGERASAHRQTIYEALETMPSGMTARELSACTGIEYHAIQRRLCEVEGIARTGEQREGCKVWAVDSKARPVQLERIFFDGQQFHA